jgi:thiol-disulfide isomerase/thioredoxin
VTLHLSWLGTYVHTMHDDHDDVVGRGDIDIVHDQHLAITEARAAVDIGLPRGFGATLLVPFRVVSTTIRYLDTDGNTVELVNPGIHHRDETLTGLADPMLLVSGGRTSGAWHLAARAGTTVPLGRTEENPFTLGDMGLPHEHIQMGSGTFEPVVSAEVARSLGAWRVGGFAFTQQSLYANDKGYQPGDRYAGGVSARRGLGRSLNLRLGAEFLAETAERWDGVTHTDDGNRGRFDLMIDAGGSWALGRGWSLDLGIKVPVVTHVVGGQLEMPAIVELGASWSFGGAKPEPHAVEHPVTTGLDVLDVTAPAPVPGKLTIVDYWATWCVACQRVEPALVALARAHPDDVAIRRIDASSWDDDPFTLPHVTVYDRTGAQVLDRSSGDDLDSFLASIRAVVEPPSTTATILVTENGFEPGNVTVPAGVPVVLTFERKTDQTCATEVVLTVDGTRIERELPLDQPVEVPLTFSTPEVITYACGMDMLHGTITVVPGASP